MKKSPIYLALITSLTLTACGGGSDNNSSSNTSGNSANPANNIEETASVNNNYNTETSKDIQQWSSYSNESGESLSFIKNTITIENDKQYTKSVGLGNTRNSIDPVYFTKSFVYQSNAVEHPEYGTQTAAILNANANEWKAQPYSNNPNANDLTFTKKIRTIDLSGSNMLETIFFDAIYAYQNTAKASAKNAIGSAMYNFLATHAESQFPEGSKCYVVLNESANVPFIKVDKSILAQTDSDSFNLEKWEDYKTQATTFYVKMNNIEGYFEPDANNKAYYGLVNYNGYKRFAEYYSSGMIYDGEAQIKELENDLSYYQDDELKFNQSLLNHLKNNYCEYYNDVASNAIKTRYIPL